MQQNFPIPDWLTSEEHGERATELKKQGDGELSWMRMQRREEVLLRLMELLLQ